jgi:hypothetical protein
MRFGAPVVGMRVLMGGFVKPFLRKPWDRLHCGVNPLSPSDGEREKREVVVTLSLRLVVYPRSVQ